jgi:serine/threonine protein kinase
MGGAIADRYPCALSCTFLCVCVPSLWVGPLQIVMEYCNAGSVADIMGICDIRLDEEQISHVCASVLLGFEYLHASRHIHRVRTYLL